MRFRSIFEMNVQLCVMLVVSICVCRGQMDDDLDDEFPEMPPPQQRQYQREYQSTYIGDKVVDAINCGGPGHTDINGVNFRADPLEGRTGVASDHGRRFLIGRVPQPDQILYQTERYSFEDLQYDFKIPGDGNYVLVLKFSEVYFHQPHMKVFDVSVNDEHMVLENLDIFGRVGHGMALDETIPFSIQNNKIHILGAASQFTGKLSVKFIKKELDNPKINAIYIMQGTVEDVPKLIPLESPDDYSNSNEETEANTPPPGPSKFASGPKLQDPYAAQDQSHMFIPILVAFACFFPLLFCLCKL